MREKLPEKTDFGNVFSINNTLSNVNDFFIFQNLPFCDLYTDENGKIQTRFSFEIEILNSYQRRFNFTSNLIDANQDWGILMLGQWTGAMAHILDGVNILKQRLGTPGWGCDC